MTADPREIDDLIRQAKISYEADQYAECIRLCEVLLQNSQPLSRTRVTALYLLGDVYIDLEQFREAIRIYDMLIANENNDIVYANRGFAYMSLGNWNSALREYLAAIQSNPNNVIAVKFAAECYMALGNNAAAISLILKIISTKSDNGALHRTIGLAYSRSEQWIEAYKAFSRAISLDPNDEISITAKNQIEKLANGRG